MANKDHHGLETVSGCAPLPPTFHCSNIGIFFFLNFKNLCHKPVYAFKLKLFNRSLFFCKKKRRKKNAKTFSVHCNNFIT